MLILNAVIFPGDFNSDLVKRCDKIKVDFISKTQKSSLNYIDQLFNSFCLCTKNVSPIELTLKSTGILFSKYEFPTETESEISFRSSLSQSINISTRIMPETSFYHLIEISDPFSIDSDNYTNLTSTLANIRQCLRITGINSEFNCLQQMELLLFETEFPVCRFPSNPFSKQYISSSREVHAMVQTILSQSAKAIHIETELSEESFLFNPMSMTKASASLLCLKFMHSRMSRIILTQQDHSFGIDAPIFTQKFESDNPISQYSCEEIVGRIDRIRKIDNVLSMSEEGDIYEPPERAQQYSLAMFSSIAAMLRPVAYLFLDCEERSMGINGNDFKAVETWMLSTKKSYRYLPTVDRTILFDLSFANYSCKITEMIGKAAGRHLLASEDSMIWDSTHKVQLNATIIEPQIQPTAIAKARIFDVVLWNPTREQTPTEAGKLHRSAEQQLDLKQEQAPSVTDSDCFYVKASPVVAIGEAEDGRENLANMIDIAIRQVSIPNEPKKTCDMNRTSTEQLKENIEPNIIYGFEVVSKQIAQQARSFEPPFKRPKQQHEQQEQLAETDIMISEDLVNDHLDIIKILYNNYKIRCSDVTLEFPVHYVIDPWTCLTIIDQNECATQSTLKQIIKGLTTQVFKWQTIWITVISSAIVTDVEAFSSNRDLLAPLYKSLVKFPVTVVTRQLSTIQSLPGLIGSIKRQCNLTAATKGFSQSTLTDTSQTNLNNQVELLQSFPCINRWAANQLIANFGIQRLVETVLEHEGNSLDNCTIKSFISNLLTEQQIKQFVQLLTINIGILRSLT